MLSTFATLGLEKLALKVLPAFREQGRWALSLGFLRFSRRRITWFSLILIVGLVGSLSVLHWLQGVEQTRLHDLRGGLPADCGTLSVQH